MPFSVEVTRQEAKRKAAQGNRVCVVHREEGRSIPLLADAMRSLRQEPRLQFYPHPWGRGCKAETPADKRARVDRVMALLEEAKQKMEADRLIIEDERAESFTVEDFELTPRKRPQPNDGDWVDA